MFRIVSFVHNKDGKGGKVVKEQFIQTGKTEPVSYAIYIGFFSGLFVSVIRLLAHGLKFTMLDNAFLIYDWFIDMDSHMLKAQLLGTISLILFSIVASLVYLSLFRTKQGAVWGIGYGIIIWLLLFVLLPELIKWPTRGIVMELDTQMFELCLSLVWGLFIGYSIAFEFTDEASYEPIYAKNDES